MGCNFYMIGAMMLASVLVLPDWLDDAYYCEQAFDIAITDLSWMNENSAPTKRPELKRPKKPIVIKLFDLNTTRPQLSHGSFNTTYYHSGEKNERYISLTGEGKHNTPQGITLERNINKEGREVFLLNSFSSFGFFENVYSVDSTFICNPFVNK
ncbi:hypothetical protein [Aeromonas schubertii]|uniref:hypothetical protein n=1 Tax=Aeromonas schubertii TaxID=652 RepID=UPI0011875B71|nr:hypothetical protein [Aeromonas schubertii]